MLPYIVLALALLYLVLHYAGVFDDVAVGVRGRESSRRQEPSHREPPPLADEVDRRLQVFEDFLKGGEPPEDDED